MYFRLNLVLYIDKNLITYLNNLFFNNFYLNKKNCFTKFLTMKKQTILFKK